MVSKIISIGAGPSQVPYITALKRMGYWVLSTDINSSAPGKLISDEFLTVSTHDLLNTLKEVTDLLGNDLSQINYVITACTGEPLRTVEFLKAKIGLSHINDSNINILLNKTLLRNFFNSAGFSSIVSWDTSKEISQSDLPVIVKPAVGGLGGQGVSICLELDKLANACRKAKIQSINDEIVIEKYISGPEIAVDAIWGGKSIIFLSTGWTLFDNKFGVIVGSTAGYDDRLMELNNEISKILGEFCHLFKLEPQILNTDIILDQNENLHLIEVEFVPAEGIHLCKEVYGYDLIKNFLNAHLGKNIQPQPDPSGNTAFIRSFEGESHNILLHKEREYAYKYFPLNTPYSIETNKGVQIVNGHYLVNGENQEELLYKLNELFPRISMERIIK